MAFGTLSIDIEARLAKLQAGLDQASKLVEKQANAMEAAFARVGSAAGGLLAGLTVGTFVQSGKAAIDLADKIDDLGEKYGIAAGTLTEYRFAAEVAGTPTDALATGMGKLSKAASEGNKGLAMIGVGVRTASGDIKSADQLLLEVATKFERFKDGPAKAALAMEIFGKSGADMLPLLNKGAAGISALRDESKALGAAFGDEVARQAGEFNDNLKKLQLASEGAKVSLMGDLLPSLISITEELIAGKKAFGGYLTAMLAIGLNTSPFQSAGENLQDIGSQIAALEKMMADISARNSSKSVWDKVLNIGSSDQVENIEGKLAKLNKVRGYLQEIQRNEALKGSGGVLDARDALAQRTPPKTQAPLISDGKNADEAAKQYASLISKIKERQAEAQAELATGAKLSDADKFRIDILAKLNGAESKLSEGQKQAVRTALDSATAAMRQAKSEEELAKARKYSADLLERSLNTIERENQTLVEGNKGLQQQVEGYGLTERALAALTLQRLDDVIAQQQQLLVAAQNAEGNQAEADALERKLNLLRRQRDLTGQLQGKAGALRDDPMAGATKAVDDYLEKISQSGEQAKQVISGAMGTLENSLTDSLAQGKLDVSSFVSYLLKEFFRLQVVQPLLKDLFSAGSSGGSGGGFLKGLMSIFGFAKGGAFSAGIPVQAFASGGVVGSASLFGMRGGLGLMGEAGPEAIMPLKRGADGKLGVAAAGGGTVVNNYNVAAGVTRNELMSALQMMRGSILGETQAMMRRQGMA